MSSLRYWKIKARRFRFKVWKNNLCSQKKKYCSWFNLEIALGLHMQLKLMILQAEVMQSVKLRSMKKVLKPQEDYYLLIWLVQRELKTANQTIKIDNKKEQKLINLFLLLKSALEHLIHRKDRQHLELMYLSELLNWLWY